MAYTLLYSRQIKEDAVLRVCIGMNTHTAALSRASGTPLAEQLAGRFAERIGQGLLGVGARLPSVRDCAVQHGVSPYTVVAAYDQLLARGLLEARKQRGFFVREPLRAAAPAQLAPDAPRPFDASALIRGMFQADARSAPGLGTLPAEWLDGAMLQAALRKVLLKSTATDPLGLHYGEPGGDARLRAALSQRLADLGIVAAPDQFVSSGGIRNPVALVRIVSSRKIAVRPPARPSCP